MEQGCRHCAGETNPRCAENDNVIPALSSFSYDAQVCMLYTMINLVTNVSSVAGVYGKLARAQVCKEDDTAWVSSWVLRR